MMTSALDDMPPEAAWQGKPVDVSHYRVPLSDCYSYIEKPNRDSTLDARKLKGVFIGYAGNSPCYLVYDPETDIVYARRYADVTFDERTKAPVNGKRDQMADTLLAQRELEYRE